MQIFDTIRPANDGQRAATTDWLVGLARARVPPYCDFLLFVHYITSSLVVVQGNLPVYGTLQV